MKEKQTNIQRLLARHPFPGSEPNALQALLGCGDEKYLQEGTLLCAEGRPSDSMFVLLDGHIDVMRKDAAGRSRKLTTLYAPALLGHMGLIDGSARSATCKAESDVRVVQFTRPRYHELVDTPGPLGATLRRLLCSSLSGQLTAGNARVHALLSEIAPSEITDDLDEARDDITREDLRQISGVLEGWKLDAEGIDHLQVVDTEDAKRRRSSSARRER